MAEGKFYIGQEVLCLVHGNGKVLDIKEGKIVPIYVQFEKGGICMYTAEGRVSPSAKPTLFDRKLVKITPGPGADQPFYTGQSVECLIHGPGQVVHVFEDKGAALPVQVEFEEGGVCSYSRTGKMSISAQRTLYPKGSVEFIKG
ncbi:MAG: hypothetical protein IJD04_06160 [Desulfovibrionaceae bacterium]|nr:hypothetical protein [Desulfovibrionaceae bacterium]